MALAGAALLSPPLNPPSSSPISTKPKPHFPWKISFKSSKSKRATLFITNATADQNQAKEEDKDKDKDKDKNKDSDTPAFNPFGFVTDNPSSRSAIQLPDSPAEDGNVGQMLYVSSILYAYMVHSFNSTVHEVKPWLKVGHYPQTFS